ncbi:MAG TPA: hypothetical protein EYM57_01315 [Gammaproteobacteria bacterium]|nr:MAG: hypothetical protein COA89_11755 [Acidithiobacillus sp.]HAD35546.1 hypothetical protein [Gammaproteobacteria bacterium]HBK75576.1 hypothetical protein [Gammaproteobacteria bacterium]HIC62206.1 hypothetical protein [Marine Group III euryarchaeote]HIM96528.1 hypothetical protein [Gammaproteobacteria bacterium]
MGFWCATSSLLSHTVLTPAAVLAVLVAAGKTAPDIQSVIDFARQQIGGYKIPRQMVFVDELPKSALGKVLKSELRSFYGISQTTQEH